MDKERKEERKEIKGRQGRKHGWKEGGRKKEKWKGDKTKVLDLCYSVE